MVTRTEGLQRFAVLEEVNPHRSESFGRIRPEDQVEVCRRLERKIEAIEARMRGVDPRRVPPVDKKNVAAMKMVLADLSDHFDDPGRRDRPFAFAGPNVLAIADAFGAGAAKDALFVDAAGDRNGDIDREETERLEAALSVLARDMFSRGSGGDAVHRRAAADLARARGARANLEAILQGRPEMSGLGGELHALRAKLARGEESISRVMADPARPLDDAERALLTGRRVALLVTSQGAHWEEVYSSFAALRDAGLEVDIVTPKGLRPDWDLASVERRPFLSNLGIGTNEEIDPMTSRYGAELSYRCLQKNVKSAEGARASDYVGAFVAGGHGSPQDLPTSSHVHDLLQGIWDRGLPLAAVCHAGMTLGSVKEDGRSILNGKHATGLPHFNDLVTSNLGLVDDAYLPLVVDHDAELRAFGADVHPIRAILYPWHTEQEERFATGCGPKAAGRTANLLIDRILRALKALQEKGAPAERSAAG
jgi:putative intracellular protease/amidase